MKTFQEFLTEAKKKRFNDALSDYADQQKKRAKTDKVISKDTKPGSEDRINQVRTLMRGQGGGKVREDQRIKRNLAIAANRAVRKGKKPEDVRSQIDAVTHQPKQKPYKPSASYDPSSRPAPGTVTNHKGETEKVNWKY